MRWTHILVNLAVSRIARAQIAAPQLTSFNSSLSLSESQIRDSNLTEEQAANLNNVINFSHSQFANGGPEEDDFYSLPPLPVNATGPPEPGTVLKVQFYTNTTPYSLPPHTGLSRMLYTSQNLNGTTIPASAFVLWPFMPRRFRNSPSSTATTGAPVVIWGHDTSGVFNPWAPSAHRALFGGESAVFDIALAGYAVVAPDFAGLGVSTAWDGTPLPLQYNASPAGAHDALYAFTAARTAFPGLLDSRFVSMGHSEGGGVAWGIAELLAAQPELGPGYLGSIAGSPTTDVFASAPQVMLPWIGAGLSGLFPDFTLSAWLTPLGVARAGLLREIGGGIVESLHLFFDDGIVLEGWRDTWYVDAFARLGNAGRKALKGPLLVLQGTEDTAVAYNITSAAVDDTCAAFPDSDLEYLLSNGTGHVAVLSAAKHVWLQWIEDRFEGVATQKRCVRSNLTSFLPDEHYQKKATWFPQWAGADEYSYELPLNV